MSYTISARTYQTNPNAYFNVVEKTTFTNALSWTQTNEENLLTMLNSGTSGILRFAAGSESFAVALGVHNYARWCDITTDLPTTQTATTLHPQYYVEGTPQANQRWKQLASCQATAKNGRKINVTYTVTTGNALKANIVIG